LDGLFLLLLAFAAGLSAQLVDGALGMAYGVTSSLSLISLGFSPVIASASVHTAEVFTTLVSGTSHLKFGNVRKNLLIPLTVFGVLGGVLGAYGLTELPTQPVRLIVNLILLTMGIIIIYKHLNYRKIGSKDPDYSFKKLSGLGFIGAALDAMGGGGWGPVCTSTLVATGSNPSKAIGSVSVAEFFVTTAEAITFLVLIGWEQFCWEAVAGLLIAGVIIAPFAAYICKKMPRKVLGILVGFVIIATTIRNLALVIA